MKNYILSTFILTVLGVAFVSCNYLYKKTQKRNRPNILFAISDDQSVGHTSFEGSGFVKTPAFDYIANNGVYFSNCFAGSPGCAPSRSSIVTGRHHWENEQAGQHASSWMKKYIPFPDLLQKNGYVVGRTGKGVQPFMYAKSNMPYMRIDEAMDEDRSLWRDSDAGGITHSNIKYTNNEERVTSGVSSTNYFENFKHFIDNVKEDKPFFFWFGAHEPHRSFEKGSWRRMGKKLSDAEVPEFLPDNEEIRGDLLDYAVEIEWFDRHLQLMIDYLKETGELDNTIIIVTSDQGMSFPRAKANCYEYGLHVPFAVYVPNEYKGGRVVDELISLTDLAPTILDITGTSRDGMLPMSGKSIINMLKSNFYHVENKDEKFIYAGRERHSSSRYLNRGYPQRVIRSNEYLLVWNMKPQRWPMGAPQRMKPGTEDELLPLYGIDEKGSHHSGWAFTDIDGSPSKSYIIENWQNQKIKPYFDLSVAKRPEFELYHIKRDPFNLNNLIGNSDYKDIEIKLREALKQELIRSNDPRMVGPDKEIFDTYTRYSSLRKFPEVE